MPWTVLTYASTKVVSVATTLVLARLLVPADFGLVALATVAIGALSLFSDLGLGGVLVIQHHLDQRGKGTVLTLMLAMGALISALIAAVSPLVGGLLDAPRLPPVLAILGVTVFIGSLTWFYETLLQRDLEFLTRFKCLTAQSITFAAVSISAAAAGAGVWSLVAGQVAGTCVYAGFLLALVPYRVRPAFDRSAARDTLLQGRGFVAQGGIGFVEMNIDYLAVGRLLGTSQLGYYSMAFRMAELPYWAITEPVAKVTFPGFARIHGRGESVRASFLSVLGLVTLLACPIGILLSAVADPFTRTVFSNDWRPMIGPLAVMGVWGTINHFEASLGWLLNSLGKAGLNGAISAVAVIPLIPAVFLAAEWGGITTVAWVMVVHAVASVLARAFFVHSRGYVPIGDQWRAVRPATFGAGASWIAARLVAEATSGTVAAASLAASVAAGAIAYAVVVSLVEPGVLARAARQLRRTLRPDVARSA